MMLLRELAPAPVARILSDAGRPERMIADEEAKVNDMLKKRPALRARPLVGTLGWREEILFRQPTAGGSSGRCSTKNMSHNH